MDIEANMKEQLDIAEDVMRIVDVADESGEFTQSQTDSLIDYAHRLAELIQAANNCNRNVPE